MPRSFSLAAYRALSPRGKRATLKNRMPRPKGDLIWIHATSHGRLAAMQDVVRRMKAQRGGLYALITTAQFTLTEAEILPNGADWVTPYGSDTEAYAKAFLAHWQPDLCVWTGGHFLPTTLTLARERKMPMLLVDADDADIRASSGSWIPNLSARMLTTFDRVFATGTETAQKLMRRGTPMDRIEVTAPLQISGNPPVTNEDEVEELAELLAGRQVWLAAHLQKDEIGIVLDAFGTAARTWHRLLVVMTPGPGMAMDEIRQQVAARGLRLVDWEAGEEPDEFTQVILTDGTGGLGLWYRLAPVAFMGGSLVPGHGGSNPFDAAALGSALLYGPNIRDHLAAYTRLAGAGAARIVKDADGLGAGVARLIAPDQAASMALAAWEVVSEGSQVTDHLMDLLHDYLDHKADS